MKLLKRPEDFTAPIRRLIEQCLYMADDKKLAKIIDLYVSESCRFFYALLENGAPQAIIGISVRKEPDNEHPSATILHIAVDDHLRTRGIGRKLIDEVIAKHQLGSIQAQTDQDSMEFYRTCGFSITSLGELFPGVERFLCEKKIQTANR